MGKKRSTSAEDAAQEDTPAAARGEEAVAPASTEGIAKARRRRSCCCCCCGCCRWLLTFLLGAAFGAASCFVALLLALDGGCGDAALAAARACMADADGFGGGQCTAAVTGTIAGCRAAADNAGGACVAAVRQADSAMSAAVLAADGACVSSMAKATATLVDILSSRGLPKELSAVGKEGAEVLAEPPAAAAATEDPLAAEPPAVSAAAAAQPPAGAAALGPEVTPAQAVLAVLDSDALRACERSDQQSTACPDLHDAMLTWIYGIDHIRAANAGAQTGMQQYVDQISTDAQDFMKIPRGHPQLREAFNGLSYNNRQVFEALREHFEPMRPTEPVGLSAPLPARGLLCRGGSCDAQ